MFIDDSSLLQNTTFGANFKCYARATISDSVVLDSVSIGSDSNIERSQIGDCVAINRRNYINDSFIGSFSYTGINTIINFAKLGKFCSIARNVDIGGFDHDYTKVTTMPSYRLKQLFSNEKPKVGIEDGYCIIGNDVWIAAGAQILHKVSIGDGAVIGAGSVVTKDVPPYAIVVGVPAKIIKFRCKEDLIDRLLKIKWWDWPKSVIQDNLDLLEEQCISEYTIERLERVLNN